MKTLLHTPFLLLSALISLLCCNCTKDVPITGYKTRHVVVLVVDGPRYSETWGHPGRTLIPNRVALLEQGVMCSNFNNNGGTYTNAGHTAICTGVYQTINNSGLEYPAYPSVFQYWLKQYERPASEAWIIASKDKLAVLSNTTHPEWKDKYRPMTDCGVNGPGTGYRSDNVTLAKVKEIFSQYHPRLTLINFKEPDAAGHSADSAAYIQGIIDTDQYIQQVWKMLQEDEFYKDRTTLIVTNDHGRHTAGHLDGFVSHGDNCAGCRRIEFLGLGPDFKKNYDHQGSYEQTDIASTIAVLMGVKIPDAQGRLMEELLIK